MQMITQLFYKSYLYPKWLILFISRSLGLLVFLIDILKNIIFRGSGLTKYKTRCFMFFDMLSQEYKIYFKKQEIVKLLEKSNLKILKEYNQSGIGITAIKQANTP